jgi:hypothetical protein
MDTPTLTDYVHIMYTLFDLFVQRQSQTADPKSGHPFMYAEKSMIVFFTTMQFRRIFKFKAERRWLEADRRCWVGKQYPIARRFHGATSNSIRRFSNLWPSSANMRPTWMKVSVVNTS